MLICVLLLCTQSRTVLYICLYNISNIYKYIYIAYVNSCLMSMFSFETARLPVLVRQVSRLVTVVPYNYQSMPYFSIICKCNHFENLYARYGTFTYVFIYFYYIDVSIFIDISDKFIFERYRYNEYSPKFYAISITSGNKSSRI